MTNLELHERFLYPVVRVFSMKAAGSGTLIYSEKDPENELLEDKIERIIRKIEKLETKLYE